MSLFRAGSTVSYACNTSSLVALIPFVGRKGTALPNLFFGAVHFLLLKGVQHQLASFYPSMSSMPGRVDLAFDSFRSFCLENSQEIRKIISTRLVQTNEVTRCACLVPVY